MGKIYKDITETVGHTPLVRLNRMGRHLDAEFLLKLEYFNPMGSLKDRIGVGMIDLMEKEGRITRDTRIVEPTSGNTGIALAFVCAARGYKLTLTMPESMSIERRKLFSLMGANVVLTPAMDGMKGSIEKATQIVAELGDAYMPNQFENPINPEIHSLTTAREILADTEGQLDVIVAGVGTGGCLTGIAREIRLRLPNLKVVAVEPESSPVLSGGMPGPHGIQGIGAGFSPPVLDRSLLDEVVRVGDENAMETARRCAREEGIACGISSGAALAAALELAQQPAYKGKRFVVIFPDFAERYASTSLFENW